MPTPHDSPPPRDASGVPESKPPATASAPALARPPADRRVVIVGTGQTVKQLAAMVNAADAGLRVVGCVISSRSPAPGLGVRVLGDLSDLRSIVARHDAQLVLVSLPLAMAGQMRRVTDQLTAAEVAWQFIPALADQLVGRVRLRLPGAAGAPRQRDASVVLDAAVGVGMPDPLALLGREMRPLDEQAIRRVVQGRVVLITGAGGSIGSELARQAARFNPQRLVLVERSENALFEIDRAMRERHPQQQRLSRMHDVTDAPGTRRLLEEVQPNVVFHAAAHKHVPMMEDHPWHAVENNFYGTRSIADAALATGVERFVMISTDKAVNPSSVMGATKRLAELYVQHLSRAGGTRYCMVRFGNVLGSNCSVLPIWSQQLSQGGPITVTHRDMTRYFMTIPEAAGLVIQSAAFAGMDTDDSHARAGGEVFLLDMGDPIRIVDLAERFLRLQGFEPGVDVEVEFTGIRPGEKLFEELAYDGENLAPTPHRSIRLWQTSVPSSDAMRSIIESFDALRNPPGAQSPWQGVTGESIVAALRAAVPEMVRLAAV